MNFVSTLKTTTLISLISFILTSCSGGSDDGESLEGKVNMTLGEYKGSKLFEGIYLGPYSKFAWIDVNDDNRLDLVIGGIDGKLKYYQATATSFEEKTGDGNPFNDIDVGEFSSPVFADLDTDDDLELVIGEGESGTLKYYDLVGSDTDNDSTNDTWTWTERTGSDNPFNGINLGQDIKVNPTFANLDTDSDLELIIGNNDGELKYYDLIGSDTDNDGTWTEQTGSANPFDDVDVGDHSAPVFAHLDTDSQLELVVGTQDGTLKYYDLVGTTWTSLTDTNNPFNGIDVGKYAAPIFVNLDTDDDDLELVIGGEDGILNYYNKEGNSWIEESTVSHNPFHSIVEYRRMAPFFVNLDTDDELELIIGEEEGKIKYYDLVGRTWTEVTGTNNPFEGIDVGRSSIPAFADFDDDGHLELVVGHAYPGRRLSYYDFVSATSTWVERTGSENPFYDIYTGENGAPSVANLDDDDDLELVIGNQYGSTSFVDLVENTWTKKTGEDNPLSQFVGQSRRWYFACFHFADLDNNGELEFIVGQSEGDLKYATLVGNTWTEQTGGNNPFDAVSFSSFSIPFSANLDDDDDLELVIGSNIEGLIYGDLYKGDWVLYK